MILQPYNGMLFSNIINELSSHKRTQEKPKCKLVSEISQFGKTTYYMISTLWHFGKIKTLEKISLVVGKEEETNSWNTEDFQDSKPILCDAVMRGVCHYTFVKIHRKCPGWCGSVGWSLPHKQQVVGFDPWSGHTPRQWFNSRPRHVKSPVWEHIGGNRSKLLLPFLLLLSLKKQKSNENMSSGEA